MLLSKFFCYLEYYLEFEWKRSPNGILAVKAESVLIAGGEVFDDISRPVCVRVVDVLSLVSLRGETRLPILVP